MVVWPRQFLICKHHPAFWPISSVLIEICRKGLIEHIWWIKFCRLVDSLGFGALVHGEVCCEISVGFLKRKRKTHKILPILRRKLRRILTLHTYSETSPQTSPAKLGQKKIANKISPVICIWQMKMLPLWALTQTCMFIGMNLATLEQILNINKMSL